MADINWTQTSTGNLLEIDWDMHIAFEDQDWEYSTSSPIEIEFTYYYFLT